MAARAPQPQVCGTKLTGGGATMSVSFSRAARTDGSNDGGGSAIVIYAARPPPDRAGGESAARSLPPLRAAAPVRQSPVSKRGSLGHNRGRSRERSCVL